MDDEELLGKIAFEWRGMCKIRTKFMDDYAQAVNRLINSGKWFEMPPLEDQLPDYLMPQQFYEYWNLERKPKPIGYESHTVDIVIGIAFFIAVIGGLTFAIFVLSGMFFK